MCCGEVFGDKAETGSWPSLEEEYKYVLGLWILILISTDFRKLQESFRELFINGRRGWGGVDYRASWDFSVQEFQEERQNLPYLAPEVLPHVKTVP